LLDLEVPLHHVLRLQPRAHGCEVTRFALGVDSCEVHSAASPTPTEEERKGGKGSSALDAAKRETLVVIKQEGRQVVAASSSSSSPVPAKL
jgi:hypothetical protein